MAALKGICTQPFAQEKSPVLEVIQIVLSDSLIGPIGSLLWIITNASELTSLYIQAQFCRTLDNLALKLLATS